MDFQIRAAELAEVFAPTDDLYFRALGSGFLTRKIVGVVRRCQCKSSIKQIDPETREPRHFDVIEVSSAQMTAVFHPDDTVYLSDVS